MAATVGATLSGVTFPLRHAGLGPHQSSAGNEYFFGRDSVNTGTVEPHKATDPMTSFTAQTAKLMSSGTTTAIEAMACYQVADVVHVVTQITTGAVYYNSFNMATDAWTLTTSETTVAAASFAPTTNYAFVSLVARSNGNVVFGYCAGLTAMSSGFNMVRYRERTGVNTYSTATNVDNGGSINWSNPIAVLGAADRVHFFLRDVTNSDAFQRTLTAANALQTFPSAFDASATGSVAHGATKGVSFASGGNTIVAVPYRSATAGQIQALARLTSADAPSVSVEAVSASANPGAASEQMLYSLAADGATLHYVYTYGISPTVAIGHDTDGGTGAWGADVDEVTGGTNNYKHTVNVYERPTGDKKLGMVVDDGGAVKYAEIDLPEQGFPFESNPIFRRVLSLR